MTTICWDGETLAADSQSTTGSTRGKAVKIAKNKAGFLVAGAGEFAVVKHWMRWVLNGMLVDDQPQTAAKSDIVIIEPRGRAVMFCGNAISQPLPRKQWAWGSGSDYALGAMAMGADARQAVAVARKLDIYTGGRIIILTPGV